MTSYFEYTTHSSGPFDPTAVVAACIEQDKHALLLEGALLPKEFFDLSSGVTGAFIHRLTLYDIRMAVIVPDVTKYSGSFQDFAREANRGTQFHFLPTREEAVAWLRSV